MKYTEPNQNPNAYYIAFRCATEIGRVMKGMGAVHQIESVKTDKRDQPINPITIETVSVRAVPNQKI